jgi:hypothetical protein
MKMAHILLDKVSSGFSAAKAWAMDPATRAQAGQFGTRVGNQLPSAVTAGRCMAFVIAQAQIITLVATTLSWSASDHWKGRVKSWNDSTNSSRFVLISMIANGVFIASQTQPLIIAYGVATLLYQIQCLRRNFTASQQVKPNDSSTTASGMNHTTTSHRKTKPKASKAPKTNRGSVRIKGVQQQQGFKAGQALREEQRLLSCILGEIDTMESKQAHAYGFFFGIGALMELPLSRMRIDQLVQDEIIDPNELKSIGNADQQTLFDAQTQLFKTCWPAMSALRDWQTCEKALPIQLGILDGIASVWEDSYWQPLRTSLGEAGKRFRQLLSKLTMTYFDHDQSDLKEIVDGRELKLRSFGSCSSCGDAPRAEQIDQSAAKQCHEISEEVGNKIKKIEKRYQKSKVCKEAAPGISAAELQTYAQAQIDELVALVGVMQGEQDRFLDLSNDSLLRSHFVLLSAVIEWQMEIWENRPMELVNLQQEINSSFREWEAQAPIRDELANVWKNHFNPSPIVFDGGGNITRPNQLKDRARWLELRPIEA